MGRHHVSFGELPAESKLKKPKEALSFLPRVLLSKMKGIILGNCVGDALGKMTEFMSCDEAHKHYAGELEYEKTIQDEHRKNWAVGDWTDDSDQMILILQQLIFAGGDIVPEEFAKRLLQWKEEGFKELGDSRGVGVGQLTTAVLSQENFITNPHDAAYKVWSTVEPKKDIAPNGAIMRTSILGTAHFHDIDTVMDLTCKACRVTHADPRCLASCIAVTTAIALILQGMKIKDYDQALELTKTALKEGKAYLTNENDDFSARGDEMEKYMLADNIKDLKLDEEGSVGYTFKALGAGFYALRKAARIYKERGLNHAKVEEKMSIYREVLSEVVMEGGDADSNAAVAGALMGGLFGVDSIPTTWVKGLNHVDWLEQYLGKYFSLMGVEA